MLLNWFRNQPQYFWSVRKLIILYRLLQTPEQTEYSLADFLLPYSFPRHLTTGSWEAFRILKCLNHLDDIGIQVEEVFLDEQLLAILQEEDTPPQLVQIACSGDAPISCSVDDLMDLCDFPATELITKEGKGEFVLHSHMPFQDSTLPLALGGFLRFSLKLNQKKMNRSLAKYLLSFRNGELTEPSQSVFGYRFSKGVVEQLLQSLAYRQGINMHFKAGYEFKKKRSRFQDEFMQCFEENHPKEFAIWNEGKYQFRFFETLLSLAEQEAVEIFGWQIDTYKQKIATQSQRFWRF